MRLREIAMKLHKVVGLLLVLGCSLLGTSAWAYDTGWMKQGVRAWYFGSNGGNNAEEAYLLGAITGTNVQVTHHSAGNYWGLPQPVEVLSDCTTDQGPCWIHPAVLKNLQGGNWMGLAINYVKHSMHTYNTFLAEFPNVPPVSPNLFLPIKALFDLKPEREIVYITFMIPYAITGAAYFDAETGLVLYYSKSSGFVTTFFILSEINYDFARKRAFAEDDGPHTGFKSQALEDSFTTGASVYITSVVETRYGKTMALHVQTLLNGGAKNTNESYCFFGDIPILTRIDWAQRMTLPPEQWNPFGEYFFWWLPPTALNRTAANIYNVAMDRTSIQPYTFASTQALQSFYFTNLWFGTDGYMTQFYAKDPTIGLNLNNISENMNEVYGLDYYRNYMGKARPAVGLFPAFGPMLLN